MGIREYASTSQRIRYWSYIEKGVSVKDTKTYDGFKCIGVYSFNSSLRVMLALVMSAAFSKKGKTLLSIWMNFRY